MTLRLDFTNMMAADGTAPRAVDGAPEAVAAIPEDDWKGVRAHVRTVHDAVLALHAAGELGFLDLPADTALHDQTTSFVSGADGKFRDVVLLGIGGSALGPLALRGALRQPSWNQLGQAARDGFPRLHVLDNVDPATITALLSRLDLEDALFVVISKSGSTAETMAQYLVVRGALERTVGEDVRRHLVFVTDPEKGALRAIARAESISALDIPANVGGRFSVLSPVGLLPAALIGIDTSALLAGAADMMARCESDDLRDNPAAAFATLQWMADTRLDRGIHVLMPYADALRDMAAWFVQLWAESLGKKASDGRSTGPTPIAALGATDQHSQVQLFMEGPPNKTVTFVAISNLAEDAAIPELHAGYPELGYLGGHNLGELLDIERRATAGALARRGRPNMTITLDRLDPWHIGSLMMLFEIATVYAGVLYGVNPLDQPGVELGKQFTYAMLGRPGSEGARREWDLLPGSDPRWVL